MSIRRKFRIFAHKRALRMKAKWILSILAAVSAAFCCNAQPKGTVVQEPVRFGDGTPVTGDAEAEELFAQDSFRTDTTFAENGDTLFIVKHESAYLRMQLEGLPADAGIDKITLVPMQGTIEELPVSIPETGTLVVWMAKQPGGLPATAVLATARDGRSWSARLRSHDLRAGTAYRWDAVCLLPEAPAPGISAHPLAATPLDIAAGEYSGITWIQGNRYAVVSDDLKGGGIVHFNIPIDSYGAVGNVTMQLADGTVAAEGKKRDSEGIAFVPSLAKLYVSSEKHQEILEYDLAGRETGKGLLIPEDLSVKSIADNYGFEALSYNDSTGLFWTTTEAPLKEDTFLPRLHRLQSFTLDGKPAERFLYQTDEPTRSAAGTVAYVFGIPAVTALDDGRLIVLEREVYVPKGNLWDKLQKAFSKHNLYLVDPVNDTAGILRKSLLCSFRTGAMDLADFEGMCLGPTLADGRRCLVLVADSQKGSGGLTQEYVKVILLSR